MPLYSHLRLSISEQPEKRILKGSEKVYHKEIKISVTLLVSLTRTFFQLLFYEVDHLATSRSELSSEIANY